MLLVGLVFLLLVPLGFATIGIKEGDWGKYKIEVIPDEMEKHFESIN
jgi:hypothetical protein